MDRNGGDVKTGGGPRLLLFFGVYAIPSVMNRRRPTEIAIIAFNARYAHASLGARCLLANLGELRERAALLEFDLQVHPRTAAEKILSQRPAIVGIGCYIWNIELVTRVSALLKILRPEIRIILGGPEISHETESQEIFRYADHVICGEGEAAFARLCRGLLEAGDTTPPSAVPPASCGLVRKLPKTVHAPLVDVAQLKLPYDLYTGDDLAHRAIYVEASRGCPFRCDYCMSSLDPAVRYFPEEALLPAFSRLLDRGAKTFRFVDRTFNIDIPFALKILSFFRERYRPGMMLHVELIPDRMPDELVEAVKQCPAGMLQFEIGIQTFNEEVARRICRPLDIAAIETNMKRLREETRVHIHADLIAGLPGEDIDSLERGFNRLLALRPQEIQLGILKRLRGAPIDRHTQEWEMVYSPHAPYEILQTREISFEQMQRIQRFARYWNLVVNNGQFIETAPLIWKDTSPYHGCRDGGDTPVSCGQPSPFAAFMAWSDWLYERTGTTANLHVLRLAKLLLEYLTTQQGMDETLVAEHLWNDYRRGNRPDVPGFLKKFMSGYAQTAGRKDTSETKRAAPRSSRLPRQSRHLND